ncbi:MAG: acetoacetate--CoA ligase [Ichthyobacteriaceae bacterium]|nr:acetoacetate--CoA ligase [Ichthyobacteriaceae bacterium]
MKELYTPKLMWKPTESFSSSSNLHYYMQWLENNFSYSFHDYDELWDWSISANTEFWESILQYYNVYYNGNFSSVTNNAKMPHTKWFEGIELSYAEHVFRNYTDDRPAVKYKTEGGDLHELSWQDLAVSVASLKHKLVQLGVEKGDVVSAYLPNNINATISFLAVNSLGAIWSSTSLDFGSKSVIDRFSQINPKLLIATDSYRYSGVTLDKTDDIKSIIENISSIENTIIISENYTKWTNTNSVNANSKKSKAVNEIINWHEIDFTSTHELIHQRVDFSHPIWILYSSGTTGIPKAITHGTGGILLEHLKYLGLHNNVKSGDVLFWYTTTGWMMWNYMNASLLLGAIIVLYEGNPNYPDNYALWSLIEQVGINHFGVGAEYIKNSMTNGLIPKNEFDLSSLVSIGSTGSVLLNDNFKWIYDNVKNDVWLTSLSGGSDVCSAFVGGNPMRPVYMGEIQGIALGCDLAVYNKDAEEVFNEQGEMVIRKPMPSMPIYFWNDKNFEKYKESYFEYYPDVWHHGDLTKITPNDGVILYGRSDAVLNRGGVRIGTSEIYRAIEGIKDIEDSMVISLENVKGNDSMPIFISMKNGKKLSSELILEIKQTIKKATSPRHVPDFFFEVSAIPYTISGKKIETPIKKIFMGGNPESCIKKGSMKKPELLDEYINLAKFV